VQEVSAIQKADIPHLFYNRKNPLFIVYSQKKCLLLHKNIKPIATNETDI